MFALIEQLLRQLRPAADTCDAQEAEQPAISAAGAAVGLRLENLTRTAVLYAAAAQEMLGAVRCCLVAGLGTWCGIFWPTC